MKNLIVADDGTPFDTAEECEKYEAVAGSRQMIEAWAKGKYNERLIKKNSNVILAWEAERDEALSVVAEAA